MECLEVESKTVQVEKNETINMDYAFILTDYPSGFLGSFLSKNLKTNQLEVNTDEKTLRSIARLKEPRDLFALPKDKDHDCTQQAPRWPIECQVIHERIRHIQSPPTQPEPYNLPTGAELKPHPVGEENGIVVFNYNPISAVNYDKPKKSKQPGDESSDSDSSSDSSPEFSTPDRRQIQMKKNRFVHMLDILRPSRNPAGGETIARNDDDNDDDAQDDDEIKSVQNNSNNKEINKQQQQQAGFSKNKAQDDGEVTWPYVMKTKPSEAVPKPMRYTPVRKHFIRDFNRLEGGADEIDSLKHTSSSEVSSSSGTSDNENDTETNWTMRGNSTKKIQADFRERSSVVPNQNFKSKTQRLFETQAELRRLKALTNSFENPNSNESQSKNRNQENAENSKLRTINNNKTNNSTTHDNSNSADKSSSIPHPAEPQFSRSAVGGSKFLSNCHPNADSYDGLIFESRFESGNLAKAVMITPTYYELYLRPDLYTSRSKQWFYFRVQKTKKDIVYRFSIVNLVKSDSLYNEGMRPLMYSTTNAKERHEGWRRCGQNIVYYLNDDENGVDYEEDSSSYSLTWNIQFEHDNDTVYFAHSYPYTYSDLQDYLMEIQKHPVKSKFCKLRLLCRSLAGNNVYYLTVTAPTADEDVIRRKKAIVVSARVHPSETPASWMMKGLMDFITGDTLAAKRLRHRFIFKLIPMLNPDGVIVGNTRNSLTGKDLNRQYRTVIRETYPSIWYTKAMIKRLIDECGVTMYCDMHAHSRKHNIFIYGCENRRNPDKKLTEQVFPLMMHKNVADKFSFEDCKFKIQRSKEGTGRIVVWMLGITNSYTIEASFGGSTLGSRRGTHFHTADYEHIGRAFCETLLDYCDDNPNKVKRTMKTFKQIKKIRKRERREKKAIKIKKLAEQERLRLKIIERLLKEGSSAEEPLNIPLTDYSSDEGHTTSSSDNEGKGSFTQSDLEGPCCAPLKAPPCSPEMNAEVRRFYQKRMRKIMQELDRVYFQPLFKKKFRALIKSKRSKTKTNNTTKPERNKKNNSNLGAKKPSSSSPPPPPPMTTTTSSVKGQECEIFKIGDNIESEKSASEKRFEFEHSIYNTPEGTRMASGLNKTPNSRVSQMKKKKLVEEDDYDGCGAEKPPPRKLRISRKLRVWLSKRNIFIFRKLKRYRNKTRSKISLPKNRAARMNYDMPTTDPGSDLLFSTDDEYFVENSDTSYRRNGRSGTHPRARRLLQSDLQRRYIEEYWYSTKIKRQMPPELIVTSPTKRNTKTQQTTGLEFPFKSMQPPVPRTAPAAQLLTTEFPMIGAPAKRTTSWHNLHSGSNKSTPKFKTNPYFSMSENSHRDELELRLSLKKKVWAGVQSERISNRDELRYRPLPLSWGLPPLSLHFTREKTKDNSNSTIKRNDNEALLNACSQKLIEWQQRKSSDRESDTVPHRSRGRFVPNLINIESSADSTEFAIQMATTKTTRKADLLNNDSKAKKRKNPLGKIAETTQLIVRTLNKTKSNTSTKISSLGIQRRIKTTNPTTSNTKLPNQSNKINKFKTGGLVATATAQSKKNRKLRASNPDLSSKETSYINTSKLASFLESKDRPFLTIDMQAPIGNLTTRKSKSKLRKKSKPNIHPNQPPTATNALTASLKKI